ncbi:chromosome segregation protein [Niveomyces insectorum RCEF 264]|uniref:Chromosome segregation protein n=1 Tax=Niveomyces insectorum RCEF 264 TaxID=1081102 RepID=A0A167ZQZ7_9HYPO|nr:chromosome segregation protein [Niveomyces insectorum RCEF 264]
MEAVGDDDRYFIFENRLASFQGHQPVAKRRTSSANGYKTPKVFSWPHKTPAPIDLARAGFFFNPQPGNPDNVRCFLCHKDLDGWEEDDDPLQEHLKHSGACGWAICAAIELELGETVNEDPRLPYLFEARKSTFAGRWPYESKKGWKCKVKQLAEAGWKYTPTLESDDNTTCAYCQLALDGWEARMSINEDRPSIATTASDMRFPADLDDSVLTIATVATQGGRKATARGRKAAGATTKSRGRKARSVKTDESDEARKLVDSRTNVDTDAVEIVEPRALAKPARGRKRGSSEMELGDATPVPETPQKRVAQVRASMSGNLLGRTGNGEYAMFDPKLYEPDEASVEAELRALKKDMEFEPSLQIEMPKRGRKTGTRKVSKQTKKKNVATPQPKSETTEHGEMGLRQPSRPFEQTEQEPEARPNLQSRPQLQHEHEPTSDPALVLASAEAAQPARKGQQKTRSKAKKVLPLLNTEEPDELHEDSIVSVSSTDAAGQSAAETQPVLLSKTRSMPPNQWNELQFSPGRNTTISHGNTTQLVSPTSAVNMMNAIPSLPAANAPVVGAPTLNTTISTAESTKVIPSQAGKALSLLPQNEQNKQGGFPTPPLPATPQRSKKFLAPAARQVTLSPSPSPRQSSDVENQPPSFYGRPMVNTKGQNAVFPTVQLAASSSTPVRVAMSPVKWHNIIGGLRSTVEWTGVDVDTVFGLEADYEGDVSKASLLKGTDLNTPEKAMTVEEFIFHNAGKAERLLKEECEVMVSMFERQGTQAMQVIESLVVAE